MRRRIAAAIAAAVLLLLAVLAVRTLSVAPPPAKEAGNAADYPVEADAAARHLAEAIRFKTISYGPERDTPRQPFIDFRKWLETTYPRVHAAATRETISEYSLLFTWPGSDPTLPPVLLMSHIDVVPVVPGSEADWEQPPFAGVLSGAYVWGRGTIDTKASLVCMMEAAEALLASGFVPTRTLMFAFGHDEEVGGPEGNVKIAEMLAARGVRLAWIADEGGILTDGIIPDVAPMVALLGVAEKGYVTLELRASAQGGHSSMPPRETAIGRLARAIDRLQNAPFESGLNQVTEGLLDAIAPASPLLRRMVYANRWLFGPAIVRAMGASSSMRAALHTTIAPTMIEAGIKENVLPPEAIAKVNFRIHPRDTVDSVVAHVVAAIADEHVDVSVFNPGREASRVSSTDTEGYRLISRTTQEIFPGTVVAPNMLAGGTDSRHYEAIADDIYRFVPIVLDGSDTARFHGTNERISIANLGRAVAFYLSLIPEATGN